jgi:hypothetical protein
MRFLKAFFLFDKDMPNKIDFLLKLFKYKEGGGG